MNLELIRYSAFQPDQGAAGIYVRRSRTNISCAMLMWPTLVGLAVRLLVLAFVYPQFLDPGRDHWEFGYEIGKIASSLVAGRGFADPFWTHTGPTALLTPVYPFALSFVFRIFGVYTQAAALVFVGFNCILSAITCIPIYLIARRAFGDRVARASAWVWAFHPYAINFSATTMWYHSCLALLLSLLFLVALRLQCSSRRLAWLGFGLLWGFTALISPIVLGTLPFVMVWCCYRVRQQQFDWMMPLCMTVLGTFLVVTPWLIRDYRVFHQPIPLRDGFWMEACVGNVGNTLHWWNDDCQPSGRRSDDAKNEFARVGELAFLNHRKEQTLGAFETDPTIFFVRTVRRIVFCWTGFWSFNPDYLREEPFDPENIIFLTSGSLLALAGLYHLSKESLRSVVLYLILLGCFPLVYYVTHVDPGYRHPLDPFVVILSVGAIYAWLDRHSRRNGRRGLEVETPG